MTTWTSGELGAIGGADELRIAARRPDGTLRDPVTIWVVRAGDDLYVRAFKGTESPWYRAVLATHDGRVESGGVTRDVTFADEADPDVRDAVDAAYRDKYRNYSAQYVDPMVTETARDATVRLVPR
ncbi:MAG TPA: DUF2255 family protein [Trebonia sp.]